MNEVFTKSIESPVGLLGIESDGESITRLTFLNKPYEIENSCEVIEKCNWQLDEYFNGKREKFDLKLKVSGTEFQQKVWNELLKIPFGKTLSYQDIAIALGDKNSVRAVGMANNKNNIALIIPCHRVIGKNGRLVGYASGVNKKAWLLKHEGAAFVENDQIEIF